MHFQLAANSHLRFSSKLKDAKEEEQAVPDYCSKVQGIAVEKKLDTAIALICSMNMPSKTAKQSEVQPVPKLVAENARKSEVT